MLGKRWEAAALLVMIDDDGGSLEGGRRWSEIEHVPPPQEELRKYLSLALLHVEQEVKVEGP